MLKDRGVNYFRINLSHTPLEEIETKILALKKFGVPIIIDTEGSQVRTGNTFDISLREGDEIKLYNQEVVCNEHSLFFTPKDIISRLALGDLILVDFNSVLLKVSDISTLVLLGGRIGGRKAVHIDNSKPLNTFSPKDLKAIELAKVHGINTFTLSFIRTKEDLVYFKSLYPEAIFYAKIETKDALLNLNEILEFSYGVLIDRGDLSKEVPIEKIPFVQKYVLNRATMAGKEAFVATNTLEKMSSSLKPDKSEANDVINTFLDGATGIALTKETATGNYPVETVNMLITLIEQLEYLGLNENSSKEEIIQSIVKNDYFDDFHVPSLLPNPHGGKLVKRVLRDFNESDLISMKKLHINEETLMDAEQIAIGAFSPLEGFMCEKDFNSVLDAMRLSNNFIWTLPIILQVKEDIAKRFVPGEKIALVYEKDNSVYAILNLEEIYSINRGEVVKKWFGTDSLDHPGVRKVMYGGNFLLGGKVDLIKRRDSPYKLHELTPEQTRRIFSERGWKKIVGFHTRNAIHRSHEFIQLEAMKNGSCDGLFVHPVIGKKKEGDFETDVIVKTYEKMINDIYPKGKVIFSAFSTFSRYAGPREAVFTALVRKNFGCTHFVVGRDHTGVGNFYTPHASHDIFNQFNPEDLGILPIKFDKVFYSEIQKKHLHELDNPSHPECMKSHISGTQVREMFQKGVSPPEWCMRSEISKIILDKIQNGEPVFVNEEKIHSAKILWFTGLSGSGKSTIANLLKENFESLGKKVLILDGDVVRKEMHVHLGFTPEDIKENNRLISEICKSEKNNYDFILVPIISPFRESRNNARRLFGEDFVEIFINCSLGECKFRDTKGLYSKAERGEISNMIGIHVPYEFPENPELVLDTSKENVEKSVSRVISFLNLKFSLLY